MAGEEEKIPFLDRVKAFNGNYTSKWLLNGETPNIVKLLDKGYCLRAAFNLINSKTGEKSHYYQILPPENQQIADMGAMGGGVTIDEDHLTPLPTVSFTPEEKNYLMAILDKYWEK